MGDVAATWRGFLGVERLNWTVTWPYPQPTTPQVLQPTHNRLFRSHDTWFDQVHGAEMGPGLLYGCISAVWLSLLYGAHTAKYTPIHLHTSTRHAHRLCVWPYTIHLLYGMYGHTPYTAIHHTPIQPPLRPRGDHTSGSPDNAPRSLLVCLNWQAG